MKRSAMRQWIPWTKGLENKREVLVMAELLKDQLTGNLEFDKRIVACACCEVWSWFDDESADGCLPFVSLLSVDCLIKIPGFGDAMRKVGWLEVYKSRLQVPHFERYLGVSAKKRLQNSYQRQRNRYEPKSCLTFVRQNEDAKEDTKSGEKEKEKEKDLKGEESPLTPLVPSDKTASAQTPQPNTESPFLIFPTIGPDAKEFHLTETKTQEYESSYPAIDVRAELRAARQWVIDNPANRKTHRGMCRFLNGWLGRAQNRAPRQGTQQPQTSTETPAERAKRLANQQGGPHHDG